MLLGFAGSQDCGTITCVKTFSESGSEVSLAHLMFLMKNKFYQIIFPLTISTGVIQTFKFGYDLVHCIAITNQKQIHLDIENTSYYNLPQVT